MTLPCGSAVGVRMMVQTALPTWWVQNKPVPGTWSEEQTLESSKSRWEVFPFTSDSATCVCLAPFQYNITLQRGEERSSRVKIFEIGEKEWKHSLGSLSKNKTKQNRTNKRQRENGKQWMVCYTVYKPTSSVCRSSIPLSRGKDVGPRVKLHQSFPSQPLLFCL